MDGKTWLQREVAALYEITRAMNASKSRKEVLAVMLERIVTELGYKAATLRLLDEEKGTLILQSAYGLSEEYLAKGPVRLSKSGLDQTVLNGEPVALADVRNDSAFQYAEAAKREGLCSVLAVPMTLHDRVIGVLRVYTNHPHEFKPEEQDFIAAIANLGAQAVCRTHFFHAFRLIAHNLNSTLDLKSVLRTLLLETVRELNVKAGSIRLLDIFPAASFFQIRRVHPLNLHFDIGLQAGMVQCFTHTHLGIMQLNIFPNQGDLNLGLLNGHLFHQGLPPGPIRLAAGTQAGAF
jgi:putative methionine-R-sulfoxide reductase with GAF domain